MFCCGLWFCIVSVVFSVCRWCVWVCGFVGVFAVWIYAVLWLVGYMVVAFARWVGVVLGLFTAALRGCGFHFNSVG